MQVSSQRQAVLPIPGPAAPRLISECELQLLPSPRVQLRGFADTLSATMGNIEWAMLQRNLVQAQIVMMACFLSVVAVAGLVAQRATSAQD